MEEKCSKQASPKSSNNNNNRKFPWTIPKRYILCFMIFMGFLLMNCERSCLSVAIVAMVSKRQVKINGHWVEADAEFHWNSKMKGIILSAFFYGYIVLQIPGGWLALRIGAKRVLGFSILIASIISCLLPVIVKYSCVLFIVARVLQGLVLGVTLPTNHVVWSNWSPPEERSSLISFSIAGLSAGMLVAMPTSGFLAEYGFAGGWPSVFYTFGIAGIIWYLFWQFLVHETPQLHKTISEEERRMILDGNDSAKKNKNDEVPWCLIVKSVPVWAIMIAHFCFDCSYYTLLICMPLFLKDVHHFTVAGTGVMAALPWLFMCLMTFAGGCLSDWLRKKIKTVNVRKLLYGTGMAGSAVFIVISGYTEQAIVTVCFMSIAVAFFGFSFTGFMVNPLDIAPKYAGIIIGLSNCISTIPGFMGPSLVGIITKDEDQGGWQLVFYVMGSISMVGIVVFTILASGDLQPWAQGNNADSESQQLMKDKDIECAKEELEKDTNNLKEIDKNILCEKNTDFQSELYTKLNFPQKKENNEENNKHPS